MKRALSEPRGNPFWSDRARSEFQLQRQRPLDLPNPTETPVRDENLPPVPNELGEWSDGSERNPLQDVSSGNQVRKGRQSSRDRSLRSDGDSKSDLPRGSFQTPASWQKSEGLMPTNREMAVGQESVHEGLKPECAMEEVASGLKTEGRMPGATPEAESRQTLEQAMGDELVQHLLKENEDLKRNLMEIQSMLARSSSQQPSSGSWSNVSPFVEVAPMTPRAVETCVRKGSPLAELKCHWGRRLMMVLSLRSLRHLLCLHFQIWSAMRRLVVARDLVIERLVGIGCQFNSELEIQIAGSCCLVGTQGCRIGI